MLGPRQVEQAALFDEFSLDCDFLKHCYGMILEPSLRAAYADSVNRRVER